jgi:hypothetical protein
VPDGTDHPHGLLDLARALDKAIDPVGWDTEEQTATRLGVEEHLLLV